MNDVSIRALLGYIRSARTVLLACDGDGENVTIPRDWLRGLIGHADAVDRITIPCAAVRKDLDAIATMTVKGDTNERLQETR
jgi:hypothetical protein